MKGYLMFWSINCKKKTRFNGQILLMAIVSMFSLCITQAQEPIVYDHLGKTIIRLKDLPEGGILNLTFKSQIDGSLQPFLVKVPKGYTTEKSWPLLVTLHGLGGGPILATEVESMVQIGPHGRGDLWYSGIGERDVFECVEIAKKIFPIDTDKIYLCGFSMGGAGTFDLGLKHPDIWAACAPVCGNCSDTEIIQNGRNLPFWINTGQRDTILPPECSKKAYDKAKQLDFNCWRYTEYEGMGHSFSIDWQEIEKWLLNLKRNPSPRHISYSTRQPNHAYWLEITEVNECGRVAHIDIIADNQILRIKSDNISNYTLRLNNNIINLSKTVVITENGKTIFDGIVPSDGRFVKTVRDANCVFKRPGLTGPLWDIYSGPCVVVYGTNTKNKGLIEAAKHCARSFCKPKWMDKVDYKIVPDTEVTQQQILANNLVLFGSPNTNKILNGIASKLPIQLKNDRLIADGKEYAGDDIGFVLIYPNPLNSQLYVAIFYGNTREAIDSFDKVWPQMGSVPQKNDFGIFKLTADGNSVQWLAKDIFDSGWKWQHAQDSGNAHVAQ
jgi:hypothetical protein